MSQTFLGGLQNNQYAIARINGEIEIGEYTIRYLKNSPIDSVCNTRITNITNKLTPGITIYTRIENISRSGGSADITLYISENSKITNITADIANLTYTKLKNNGSMQIKLLCENRIEVDIAYFIEYLGSILYKCGNSDIYKDIRDNKIFLLEIL